MNAYTKDFDICASAALDVLTPANVASVPTLQTASRGGASQVPKLCVCHEEVIGHAMSGKELLGDFDGLGVHLAPCMHDETLRPHKSHHPGIRLTLQD